VAGSTKFMGAYFRIMQAALHVAKIGLSALWLWNSPLKSCELYNVATSKGSVTCVSEPFGMLCQQS